MIVCTRKRNAIASSATLTNSNGAVMVSVSLSKIPLIPDTGSRKGKKRITCFQLREIASGARGCQNGRSLLFQLQRQGSSVWRHFHQPSEDILWFYQELLAVYQEWGISVRVEEFAEIISRLSRFLESED